MEDSQSQEDLGMSSEVEELKIEVSDLKAEVGFLRAEIRLIKRKLRDQDPLEDKYRHVIERILSETLDNQCYWKMVRFDPRAFDTYHSTYKSTSSKPKNKGTHTGKLYHGPYSNSKRLSRSEITDDDSSLHSLDEDVPFRAGLGLGELSGSDEDIYAPNDSATRQSHSSTRSNKPKNGSKPQYSKPCPKSQKKVVTVSRSPGTVIHSYEFKLKACKRSKEIGSTAAGREFNTSESNIRSWCKKFTKAGISFEPTTAEANTNGGSGPGTEPASIMEQDLQELANQAAEPEIELKTWEDNEGQGQSDSDVSYGSNEVYTPENDSARAKRKRRRTSTVDVKPDSGPGPILSGMGRRRLDIWKFFEYGDPRPGVKRVPMVCKYCETEVSAEPLRLRRHLTRCDKFKKKDRDS